MGVKDAIFSNARFFNRQLAAACSLIALSSFNYGFDNQAFATTQAMDAFDKQFGVFDDAKQTWVLPPSWLSLFNSLNYISFAAGVLIGSYVSSKFGRRVCMFCMSVYALMTATIAVTSQTKEQIMAARILNYIYVGMELSVVPAFQSEIVPAPARGFIVGTYQLSLIVGGLIINCICFGTSKFLDNRAWRIPIGLFYVIPSIIMSLIWFVPESPRWLLQKGRVEEARTNLYKLRQGAGAFTNEQIEEEFRETRLQLESEVEKERFWEVFSRKNLRQTLVVVGINFFQQATGQQFASQYGTIYAKSLGTIDPFVFSIIIAAVNLTAIVISLAVNDKIGRRPMLLASACCMCVGLMTMGGLGTPTVLTEQIKIAIISMLCVMTFGFSLGFAPLTYVVATEIPAMRLRDATLRLGFFVNVLFNFFSNFIFPYLMYPPYANWGSKTGFFFGSLSFLSILFIYFCVPECKGKTLEQINRMFDEGVPLRKFGSYNASNLLAAPSKLKDVEDQHTSIEMEEKTSVKSEEVQ